MRRYVTVLALLILGLVPAATAGTTAPLGYIVVLEDGVSTSAVAADQAQDLGLNVGFVYRNALHGYSALVPPGSLAALKADPRVAYVERDSIVHVDTTQTGATWGIDRIDQRALAAQRHLHLHGDRRRCHGLRDRHRHPQDAHAVRRPRRPRRRHDDADSAVTSDDCHGHGTHVAGTIGGATYGVAKSVRLVAVRVLTCAGTGLNSGVIAGVDWVTGNHQAGQPAVANMSLGGGKSAALEQAVANSIADGVTYGVAAGNETEDACTGSPSGLAAAITVGATESNGRTRELQRLRPVRRLLRAGLEHHLGVRISRTPARRRSAARRWRRRTSWAPQRSISRALRPRRRSRSATGSTT